MNVEVLECMFVVGKDGVLLCFGLGKGWLDVGNLVCVVIYLGCCVVFDLQYLVVWKLLGKVWLVSGQLQVVCEVWQCGLSVVGSKGDQQVCKEMQVFLCCLDCEQVVLVKVG